MEAHTKDEEHFGRCGIVHSPTNLAFLMEKMTGKSQRKKPRGIQRKFLQFTSDAFRRHYI